MILFMQSLTNLICRISAKDFYKYTHTTIDAQKDIAHNGRNIT